MENWRFEHIKTAHLENWRCKKTPGKLEEHQENSLSQVGCPKAETQKPIRNCIFMKCCLVQVECYAEHETLGEDKKAFIHVIEILGGSSQNINILRYLVLCECR